MNEERNVSLQKIVWGLSLVALGLLFLADNLDYLDLGSLWQFWPLILIAFGIARIVQPEKDEQRSSGVWMLAIGCWLLVGSLGLFGLGYGSSWPLLLVAIGASMVFQAMFAGDKSSDRKGESHELR